MRGGTVHAPDQPMCTFLAPHQMAKCGNLSEARKSRINMHRWFLENVSFWDGSWECKGPAAGPPRCMCSVLSVPFLRSLTNEHLGTAVQHCPGGPYLLAQLQFQCFPSDQPTSVTIFCYSTTPSSSSTATVDSTTKSVNISLQTSLIRPVCHSCAAVLPLTAFSRQHTSGATVRLGLFMTSASTSIHQAQPFFFFSTFPTSNQSTRVGRVSGIPSASCSDSSTLPKLRPLQGPHFVSPPLLLLEIPRHTILLFIITWPRFESLPKEQPSKHMG